MRRPVLFNLLLPIWLAAITLVLQLVARADPAVQVTIQAEATTLKLGTSTVLHVYAQLVPAVLTNTDQIFSWYVDLLNSDGTIIQADPASIKVPTSDHDPATSSKGHSDGTNVHGIYDTFLGLPGAGHDAPVELFSLNVKAIKAGKATMRVGPGTGVPGLNADFIASSINPGPPPTGGSYDQAKVDINAFSNTAPTIDAVPDASIDEGSLLTFKVVGHDPDATQILTYSLTGTVPSGAAINPTNGVFTWKPSESQGPGVYPFGVKVADNGVPPLAAATNFTVTVNEVNTPPVVQTPGNLTVHELVKLQASCTATDKDLLHGHTPSTNHIAFSLVNPPAGATIDPASGQFSWTPTEAQGPGTYTITVVATDDGTPPLTGTNTFDVVVTEVNLPPTLTAPPSQTVPELTTMNVGFVANDPDLPPNHISFLLLSAPPGVVLDAGTGGITWTPTEAQGPGSYTIVVSASDNANPPLSVTNSFSVRVTEVNSPPTLAPTGDQTIAELSKLIVTNKATDADLPAQALAFSLVTPPQGATIDPQTGVFTWVPTEAQGPGTYTIVTRVTDNGTPALSDTKSFNVTVLETNSPPVLKVPPDQTIQALSTLTVTNTATDPDIPANALTFSLVNPPDGAAIDPLTGVVSWTPGQLQSPGSYTLAVKVTDNGSPPLAATNSFKVQVTTLNRAPALAPLAPLTVSELTLLTLTNSASDPDLPTNKLTFSIASGPSGVSVDPASGVLRWTPTEAQGPGSYSITIKVTDNGTPALSDTKNLNVTVLEVNSPPTLQVPPDQSIKALKTLTVTNHASDSDLPANALTFSILNPPGGAVIDPSTGVLTWTPTLSQSPASYTLSVVVTDNGVPPLSTTNSFRVQVDALNSPPVLAPIPPQTVAEQTTLTVTNSATDPDLPPQKLTFSLVSPPPGASINPQTGVLTWTPTEAQGPGTYDIVVQVVDNGTPAFSATNSYKVTVLEVNTPPSVQVPADRTIKALSTLTVTNHATDTDLPANLLTFSLSNPPDGAKIDPSTGVLTWTPFQSQAAATYTLAVVATDNGVPPMSGTNTFRVVVSSLNQPPVLAPLGPQTVTEQTTLTVTNVATDPDLPPQQLTFALANPPEGANINPQTGVLTWTPTEAQGPGIYDLVVHVTDSGIPPLSATNTYKVTVLESNLPPVLQQPPGQSIKASATLSLTNHASDPDLPANTLSFSLPTAPTGAVIDPASGVLTWTPSPSQGPGSYPFTIKVTDSGTPPLSDNKSFTVTVVSDNQPPVFLATADQTISPGDTLVLTNKATDPDLPAQVLTFALVSGPAGVSIQPSTGVLSWSAPTNQPLGSYPVVLKVTDNGAPPLSATNTFHITVAPKGGGSPATLTPVGLSGTDFKVQIKGTPNAQYTLQWSSDLKHWTDLGSVTLSASGTATFTDSTSSGSKVRFYRATTGGSLPASSRVGISVTDLKVTVTGTPNTQYTVQASSDLKHWAVVGTVTLGGSTTGTFTDTTTPRPKTRFYRTFAGFGP